LLDRRVDEWNDTVSQFAFVMHSALSIFTAGLLFIHAAFGCCWHHAHHCASHSPKFIAAERLGCCHHHDHGDSKEQHQPCGCKIECRGSCTYLLPQKVQIESPQTVVSFDLVATLPALADAQVKSASWSHVGDSPHGAVPPVGLHLLHQALLN
jgi:hypothetical protein